MAAKVVIVAVPTVLSIASIRVYTVKEAPTDGLVPREKLNIYTPLPQTTQAQFVPERTGVIQSGLTRARESILPFYQAVKGACVSFKRGSVNLYHTGEDVFYYLKDPPPEFLPRFGTITMAGLLGMFLTRKGSRFQRLAVPLSLMTAGATVCYPAQSVAVLKVTSKKVYAAGQWSSAAVSSLLSPKPVAKETVASQPQGGTVPNPEAAAVKETSEAGSSSAQSSTIPETEVELAESVSVSDEPVAAVTSSVTLAEVSPEQAPTETNTDPVATTVPVEPKTSSASGDVPVPVESEESSDTKQAVNDISTEASPAESTQNLELDTVAAVPVEAAPAESAEAGSLPSSEELPTLKTSDEPAGPVVDSADPEPAPPPESSDPPQVAAVEETPTLTLTPTPPPQQPAADHSKDGSGFKADPALMDFGQANPEDEDLYSTRS